MTRPPLAGRLRVARALAALLALPCLFMLLAVPARALRFEEWLSFGVTAALLLLSLATFIGLARRRELGRRAGMVAGAVALVMFVVRVSPLLRLWDAGPLGRASALVAGLTYLGLALVGALCATSDALPRDAR